MNRLPLAGSSSANSMTLFDHRSTAANSPVSHLTTLATNDSATVNIGSPMDSMSDICSEAQREPLATGRA